MKKVISSLLITGCLIYTGASVYAEEQVCEIVEVKADETVSFSFEGINVVATGNTLRLSSDYHGMTVASLKKYTCSKTDNEYIFKPEEDGKYIMIFDERLQTSAPHKEGSIYFPDMCFYAIPVRFSNNTAYFMEDGMYRIKELREDDWNVKIEVKNGNGDIEYPFDDYEDEYDRVVVALYDYISCAFADEGCCWLTWIGDDGETQSEFMVNIQDSEQEEVYNTEKVDGKEKLTVCRYGGYLPKSKVSWAEGITRPEKYVFADGYFEIDGEITTVKKCGFKTIRYTMENSDVLSSLKIEEFPDYDVNADGSFSIADLVTLQRYLLAEPDAGMYYWWAADTCTDGVISAFDLVQMKKELIKAQSLNG